MQIERERSRSNEKPGKFRIDSLSFFLTYPRLDMTKERALEALKLKMAGKPIKGAVVSQMPGAKTYILPVRGDSGKFVRGSLTIDAYEHNSNTISATSQITWPAQVFGQPMVTPTSLITYSQTAIRNVCLFAYRVKSFRDADFTQGVIPRASLKVEQHYTLVDPLPLQPVVASTVANNQVA